MVIGVAIGASIVSRQDDAQKYPVQSSNLWGDRCRGPKPFNRKLVRGCKALNITLCENTLKTSWLFFLNLFLQPVCCQHSEAETFAGFRSSSSGNLSFSMDDWRNVEALPSSHPQSSVYIQPNQTSIYSCRNIFDIWLVYRALRVPPPLAHKCEVLWWILGKLYHVSVGNAECACITVHRCSPGRSASSFFVMY